MGKRKRKSADQKSKENAAACKRKREARKINDDNFLKKEAERISKYKSQVHTWSDEHKNKYFRTANNRSRANKKIQNSNKEINKKEIKQPWETSRRKRVRREAKNLKVVISKKTGKSAILHWSGSHRIST